MNKILNYPEDLKTEVFDKVFFHNPEKRTLALKFLNKPRIGNFRQMLKDIQSGLHAPTTKTLYRLAAAGIQFKMNPDCRRVVRVSELQDHLVKVGISQNKLAEMVDVDKSVMSYYLSMQRFPSCDRMLEIAKALHVQIRFDDYHRVKGLGND